MDDFVSMANPVEICPDFAENLYHKQRPSTSACRKKQSIESPNKTHDVLVRKALRHRPELLLRCSASHDARAPYGSAKPSLNYKAQTRGLWGVMRTHVCAAFSRKALFRLCLRANEGEWLCCVV